MMVFGLSVRQRVGVAAHSAAMYLAIHHGWASSAAFYAAAIVAEWTVGVVFEQLAWGRLRAAAAGIKDGDHEGG